MSQRVFIAATILHGKVSRETFRYAHAIADSRANLHPSRPFDEYGRCAPSRADVVKALSETNEVFEALMLADALLLAAAAKKET